MRKRQVWKKKTGLYLYIKAANIKCLLSGLKNLLVSKELYPSDGWVTHVRVDRNPLKKGGTISVWIKYASNATPGTWGDGPAKTVRKQWPSRCDVILPKSCRWIEFVKYYILYDCAYKSGYNRYLEVRITRNPPCNAKDNLRAGHIVIEAWFRGY